MTGAPSPPSAGKGGGNLTWHGGSVSPEQRREVLGHGAACVWFTGLSGSGKSTLARSLEAELVGRGVQAYVLDGDNLRMGLNQDLGFGPEDRSENIRRVSELARLFADSGAVVITAFISPYRADRARGRQLLGDRFIEVLVDPGLSVCEARDPKGLYQRARAGEIENFTGVSAPYEAPAAPELHIDTGANSVQECTQQVLSLLVNRGIL